MRQASDLVTIDVQGPDGRYELAAKFLVGADGGHSIVRKQCGIDFPGVTDRSFTGRAGLVDAAKEWGDRVDVVTAATAEPPAEAVLIRPDGYVAWAAATGEPAPAELREALQTWFGDPVT